MGLSQLREKTTLDIFFELALSDQNDMENDISIPFSMKDITANDVADAFQRVLDYNIN